MKYLTEFLESWLPTKWSRWIAALTLVLLLPSTYLPEFLQRYDIQLSKEKILLIRGSVPLLILLLGSFSILLIVVRHYNTLKTPKKPASEPPKPITKLSKLQDSILLYMHKHISGSFTFQIAQSLNMSETIAEYHLQELHKVNFIRQGLPDKPGRLWHITDKGIKYLIENKLIS
jgi:hypothetical protein